MKPTLLAPNAAGRLPAYVMPVIVELRGTVRRISVLMTRILDVDATDRAEHIKLAIGLLDQSSAALDFAGLDDVAALPQLMRRALALVAAASIPLSPALGRALDRSLAALLCHFNAYATVAAHLLPALRLYPAYRALSMGLGEAKVSPAALLSLQTDASVALDMTTYRQLPRDNQRQQFELALLHYLRAQSLPAQQSAAATMATLMGDIAARQPDGNTRTAWQVLVAYAELAGQDASVDITVAKKIFSCAGRLIRHLGYTEVGKPPPMLVREALMDIARTSCPTPLVQTIRLMFRLEQQLKIDFDVDYYGLCEPVALSALRTALDGSRRALDADPGTPSFLAPQLQSLATAAAAVPVFGAISAALQRVADRLNGKNLSRPQAMQLAVCLLKLELFITEPDELVGVLTWVPGILNDVLASLNDIAYQSDAEETGASGPDHDSAFLAARSLSTQHAPTIAALSGASWVQWRSAVIALKATLMQTLASVESRLDDEMPGAGVAISDALPALNSWLIQLSSALLILGERDAAACATQLRDLLVEQGQQDGTINAELCAAVASQFVRLSTMIDTMTCVPSLQHMDGEPAGPELELMPAGAQEALLPSASDGPAGAGQSALALFSASAADTAGTLHSSPLLMIYLDEAQQLTGQLDWLLSCWLDAPQKSLPVAAIHAAHSLAGSSATVGVQSLHELAAALEEVLQEFAETCAPAPDALRPLLPEIIDALQTMLTQLAQHGTPRLDSALTDKLAAIKSAIQPSICRPSVSDAGTPATPVALPDEDFMLTVGQSQSPPSGADTLTDQQAVQQSVWQVGQQAAQAPSLLTASDQGAGVDAAVDAIVAPEFDTEVVPEVDTEVDTEVDAELLAIFIDEAADLLPQLGQQLRVWHEAPADKSPTSGVLRILHTLKGSARMAGAADLGQRLHELEHAVNVLVHVDVASAKTIASLLADLDGIMHAYFMLAQPRLPHATPVSDTSADTLVPAHQPAAESVAASPVSVPVATTTAKPVSPSLQLRVRADLLDRISSEAAELVVGSARIGSQLQQQRLAMSELTANLARLRSQLRELDIQAETSIASQLAPAAAREFDPLEFDRFTRLQELSRMMTESMADVLSLQRSINRHADTAELAMAAQLRHARAVQSDFRRVRVVPFINTAERLYHLVRQVARELGRQARLDITGGELELDRGILEKISAPLEHLLRNAVVHGIEAPDQRLAAGKSEQGCVHITLSQQGNDVVLQLADDGRGLDLARIREQAILAGLFASDARPTDAELVDCIFAPGLSTAREITTLAGRGIGMDVVRATVLAQGGALTVRSEAGQGTCFTIVLPLTLATVQVVLARAGTHQIALQATQVQQVLKISPDQANAARADGTLVWREQSLRLYRLEALLEPASVTPARQAMPGVFVILRQLDHLIALELDAVTGNREIVVKNLGAQLASVPGIAGATMLADTSIVLIINPFALLASARAESRDAMSLAPPSDATATVTPPAAMVMVVDDSLTMRRVSQRVLERHGYATTLARDGLDALEKLHAMPPPSAILLDIEMPRMDGFDLLRNLRQDPKLRAVPVVMITSRTAARHREHAMQLGANAYLGKPYQEDTLLEALEQVCTPAHRHVESVREIFLDA